MTRSAGAFGEVSKHVAVVGAGVIGLCIALYCIERGWRVTVVERNGEARDGCSFGNGGMIVPSHMVPLAAPGAVSQGLKWMLQPGAPFHIEPRLSWELFEWAFRFWKAANAEHVRRAAPLLRNLHLASRACYQDLAATEPSIAFKPTGTLMLCKTQHGLDEEARTAELARELGMEAQVLDAQGTAALDPDVRMDVMGSVHFPLDASVIPGRLVSALQRRVAEGGAQFHWNSAVTAFRTEDGAVRSLATDTGETVTADEFVIAAGAWAGHLARPLGLRLPMQAGKGYSLTLSRPRVQPRHCAILVESRMFVSPMGEGLRMGGTMEMAGLDDSVNPVRVRTMIDAMPGYYPDFAPGDFAGLQPWSGLRPCSPDGLPYVGRTRRLSNLLVAAGHAMMGVSLAPVTGRLVAEILAGERPQIDLALLSPDRYH